MTTTETAPDSELQPVAVDADILVSTAALRAALTAVLPHADTDPELPEQCRIVIDIRPDEALLWATDTLSAGLAAVEVISHQSPSVGRCAILPADAKKILSIFKAGKESFDEPEFIVQLEVSAEHVTITDQSGLIPGRRFRVPQLHEPESNAPAVDRMLAAMHAVRTDRIEEVAFNGETLARFKAAAGAMREQVQVRGVEGRRTLLVLCGARFIGALMAGATSEEVEQERDRWRSAWSLRLPAPTRSETPT